MGVNAAARPPADRLAEETTWRDGLRYVGRLLWRDRSGIIGVVLLTFIVLSAVFAPLITTYPPDQQNLRASKLPPAWQDGGAWDHPLGTDNLGRDIWSRLAYGARVSLTVSFFGVLLAAGLGLIIGGIAGYFGGKVDSVIMAPINLILSLPYLLFVVFIAAILGRSLINVILIFGITDAPIFRTRHPGRGVAHLEVALRRIGRLGGRELAAHPLRSHHAESDRPAHHAGDLRDVGHDLL